MTVDCPSCGCAIDVRPVDYTDDAPEIVECPCCETVWLATGEGIDQILVGPEG